jgi:Leucine-rich repeat (LRR) protein
MMPIAQADEGLELIYKNKTGVLPKDLMERYPNITSLVATNSKLTELSRAFRRKQLFLKNLDLSQNLLTEIREWEFCGLSNLKTLSLAKNLLKILVVKAFYGLGVIQQIILSQNRLQQLDVQFYHTVEELRIDNNRLETFNMALIVSKKSQIRKLQLQNNQIVGIKLNKKILVRELNLSGNNIVDFSFLSYCTSLESLDLSINVNAALYRWTFKENPNLRILTMQNVSLNREMAWYNVLSYSNSNLEELDVGFNDLESINFERMPNLPKLRSMNLTGNELTEFNTSKLTAHCGNLSEIDITGNKMNDSTLEALVQYCRDNHITLLGLKRGNNTLTDNAVIVAGIAIALTVMSSVVLVIWLNNISSIRRYQKGVDLNVYFDSDVSSTEDDSDADSRLDPIYLQY